MSNLSKQLCEALKGSLSGKKVRPPEAGQIIWQAFRSLNMTRTYGMSGPDPLQPTQIAAYCQIMRLPLEPRHIEAIFEMDQIWMRSVRSEPTQSVKVSASPLTNDLFDHMFGAA